MLNLQRIKETPLLDVAERLGIRVYGRNSRYRQCRCFYHDDHHPSMVLNLTNNTFFCYVCCKGGDVIRFVQDAMGVTFQEAVQYLGGDVFESRKLQPIDNGQWIIDNYTSSVSPCVTPSCRGNRESSERHRVYTNDRVANANHPNCPLSIVNCQLSEARSQLSINHQSEFFRAMITSGLLTEEQMQRAAERYQLGATEDGGVIFWQRDEHRQIIDGKIMFYRPDGHRDHNRPPTWVSFRQGIRVEHNGLFQPIDNGQWTARHPDRVTLSPSEATERIDNYSSSVGDNYTSAVGDNYTSSVGADSRVCPNTCPPTAGKHVDDTQIDTQAGQGRHGSLPLPRMLRLPSINQRDVEVAINQSADACIEQSSIAVVESEKTAVICSELLPGAEWMASGGLTALKPEKLLPLRGRRIILFPDTDPEGKAYRLWSQIAEEASQMMHQPIYVSDYLERHATPEQKARKIDIADLIVESSSTKLTARHPEG